MNFKQYRTGKGLTQDQAADLIGMSGSYWSTLEAGQQPEAKAKAFARVLKYLDHPSIDKPLDLVGMSSVLNYGLSYKDASALIGAGDSTWSSLANGHLQAKRRWIRSVNALLIELAESKKPALDLTPGGDIEIVQPVLTPADESPVVEEEISDQPGLIPFAYGSQKVRVKWINEEPWFMLSDVCRAIGYKSIQHAISLIRERDIQKVEVIDSMGRAQFANFVSERGMSQFFLRARVPAVEPFQDWVFDEVLPQIRKTGSYQAQPAQIDPIDAAILSLQRIKQIEAQQAQLTATIQDQAQQIAEIEARPAFDSSQSARATIHELQRIKERKRDLHRLKSAIVKQAEANTDSYSKEFRKHGRVWRYIHAEANPPVSCVNDYLTIAQINTAIEAAQILLTRLGGVMPLQLSININDGAA